MISQVIIENIQMTLNWGFAGAVSHAVAGDLALLVFVLYDRLLGLSTLVGESSTRREGGSAVIWAGAPGSRSWRCSAASATGSQALGRPSRTARGSADGPSVAPRTVGDGA